MTTDKKNNQFLMQGSILAIASLLVRIIGLLYRIPLVRIIGQEGMGIYNQSFEVYNIALILSSYSLPLAVSRLVAVKRAKKEHKNAYRIFLSAMIFAIMVGLIAALVLFFTAELIADKIYKLPDMTLPLRILAPTIFIFSIMGVLRGFYQGKNTMIPTAVSQVLEQIINAIVSIAAAYILMQNFRSYDNTAAYGAAGSTLGTFSGACIGLLFLLFVFIVYKPVLNRQSRRDKTKEVDSYGAIMKLLFITIAPVILSQTVYQLGGLLDGALFGNIMSLKQVTPSDSEVLNTVAGNLYTYKDRAYLLGIYGAEYRVLTNVPVAIATAIGAAAVASISADFSNGMIDTIRSKVHIAIKANMLIAIPSAVGMGVLASPIMKLLFDDSSRLSANVMILGCVSIVFYALSTISSAILQGINRLNVPVINSAVSLGIHIIMVFCLLKFTDLSIYALVIGNVTFPLIVSIMNWIAVEKYLHYQQDIIRTFVIPAVCAGIMGVAAYFINQGILLLTRSNLFSTMISIILAVLIYFLLLVFLRGVNEEELTSLPKGRTILSALKKLRLL